MGELAETCMVYDMLCGFRSLAFCFSSQFVYSSLVRPVHCGALNGIFGLGTRNEL